MKFIILDKILSLIILSQLTGQGKHLYIAKILKILKIKFRKIKISSLETWYNHKQKL